VRNADARDAVVAQTNGLGANWVVVSGSTLTNLFNIPVVITNGSVFFRLVYP